MGKNGSDFFEKMFAEKWAEAEKNESDLFEKAKKFAETLTEMTKECGLRLESEAEYAGSVGLIKVEDGGLEGRYEVYASTSDSVTVKWESQPTCDSCGEVMSTSGSIMREVEDSDGKWASPVAFCENCKTFQEI